MPHDKDTTHWHEPSGNKKAGFGEFRMADYGAMKAGVMSFTRTIAKEYGRYGIRANTVCPGLGHP